MQIPAGLNWWRGEPGGSEWLDALPQLVQELVGAWSLRAEAPFVPASVAFVAPVRLADGQPAVLKVNKPEAESAQEADALDHWGGGGAVRLLAQDKERHALLLERCVPGTRLRELAEPAALEVAASILRRFRRPGPAAAQYRLLADVARGWTVEIQDRWTEFGRPYERALLDFAVERIEDLAASATESVVLHQDLHAENILRAEREPWLAIDPKPLVGDPAFDAASLLRDRRDELARQPDPARLIRWRLDALTDLLALDRERLRGWGVVHALAWASGNGDADRLLVACARLLAAA
jgi:streptomycin 6-kinase